ncbi:AAA family ATPase [Mycolicibacterium sp. XJ1819]
MRTSGANLKSTPPPESALQAIEAGVRERGGVVLIGPAGAGKSTLVDAAVSRLASRFDRVDRVIATASTAEVPLAAFGDLIEVPDTGKTAEVLRAARQRLGDGRLLVVEDAHLLDEVSATLVYQLAVGRAATLIVTAAANGAVAESISTLWEDGLLSPVEVGPAGHDDQRAATLVHELVAGLPDGAHRVLQYLAVSDPLPLDEVVELAGHDAVTEAEAAGAAVRDGDRIRPAHPLFVDAVRDALGGPELRRLRTAVVERLADRPTRGVVDRLRLAVLALDSDHPQPVEEVTGAADEALRLGDLVLSERLARAAVHRSPTLTARLTLAYALAWQGRGREADSVLAEVDPASLSESELMQWALPRAANQFWMLSEPERATAFLKATRNRVSSPSAQTTLDALSATFAMNAGTPARAKQIADGVLASSSADDTAVGWAAAAAALSCSRMGNFAVVDGLAERALAAEHPGLLRFTSGFGQTTALVMAGRLDDAQTLAQQLTDYAQMQQPGRAIGEVLVADVLIAKGELDDAVRLLQRAATALAPTGYSWGPLAWMLLASALGQLGATVEAGKALARAESRHGLKSMLFAPELALARAWTMSARRDTHGAVAAARDAVRSAERGGQWAVALRALLDTARLGDLRAVDGVTRIGAEVDCAVGELTLAFARALVARDATALGEVSQRFAALGMHRTAADAAAQLSS